MALGAFALFSLAGAVLGNVVLVSAGDIRLPALWPLSGVLVGTLLLVPARRWASLVLTACAAMLIADAAAGQPLLPSAAFACVFGAESVAAAWVLRRSVPRFSLTHFSHLWTLVWVAALAPMAGGLAIAGLLSLEGGAAFAIWRAWWLKDALGMLLFAPIAVAAITDPRSIVSATSRGKTLELAAVLVAGSIMSALVFGGLAHPLIRVPAYLLPFFLWSVFRFTIAGSAATIGVMVFIGLWNTSQGRGPFVLPGATLEEWVLRSQGTIGIAAASLLLMAAAVAERRRVAGENERLIAELQAALAEIKTLRGFIPICAWCHKVRDDTGFWQQIEHYLDSNTDATISHGICPSCSERAHREIQAQRWNVESDSTG